MSRLRDPASDWIARSRETPDLSSNAIYMGANVFFAVDAHQGNQRLRRADGERAADGVRAEDEVEAVAGTATGRAPSARP